MMREKSQKCLLLTSDREAKEVTYKVAQGSVIDEKGSRAWVRTAHTFIRKKDSSAFYQPVSEIDCMPIVLDGKRPRLPKPITTIAKEARERETANAGKEARRERNWELLVIMAVVVGIFICVMATAGLIQSGKLRVV